MRLTRAAQKRSVGSMKDTAIQKMLDNQPIPLMWAIVMLPPVRRMTGWRTVETVWNGGFYARDDGLLARCRGLEAPEGVRWWHVILGRKTASLTRADVFEAIRVFFPPRAMVMEVHLPDEEQDQQEHAGQVIHLWWSVDGNSGVPPCGTWESDAVFAGPDPAQTYED